jgi:cullin 1
MCSNAGLYDHSKALYDRTKDEIEHVLQHYVVPELNKNKYADEGNAILNKFSHHWENHKVFVKWMQQLFRHLDNGYIANSSISTITSVGLKLFFDIVFVQFKAEVRESLLNAIDTERDGINIDQDLLRSCVEVFPVMGLSSKCTTLKTVQSALNTQPDLSVYESDLEISLLKRTSDYYARKSRVWLEDQTTPEYLTRAEMALKAERNRVKRYLHPSTQSKLLSACEQELLQKYKGPLINHDQSGLRSLLAEDRNEDLRRMFNLFRRLADGLSPMALMTKKFVQSEGNKLLQERRDLIHSLKSKGRKLSSNDPDLIDQLMTLHSKMSRLVLELFDNEAQFQRALREAFQEVMNADTTSDDSNVELLVVHTDRILSGKLKLDEEEVENRLEHCIQLFQFVSDKDLYAELYRERLAKRLLSKKYTSIHAEKSMIVKMKTQQGAPFTTKLEGMVNDFTVGSYQLSLFNSFSFLS